MTLPTVSRNHPNAEIVMKAALLLLSVCFGLLLAGCADQSLITDEEYRERKGPAAHSPDPTAHLYGY